MGPTTRQTLKRFTAIALLAALTFGARVESGIATLSAAELPEVTVRGQIDQALELFSRPYFNLALSVDPNSDLRPFILKTIEAQLPKKQKHTAFAVAYSIISEANHHGMDPLFLMAVIRTESHFNATVRGRHGEIGMMQILPRTAKWLAPQAGISENAIRLDNPAINIRIGATYFAHLRRTFNGQGNRYIAAYNMGTRNVFRLIAKNTEPAIYPNRVMKNYKNFYAGLEKAVGAKAADRSVALAN